ncbi:MAG: LysM peptidoglycan-binding domain-containing protein [Mucilaginibacter sp.]
MKFKILFLALSLLSFSRLFAKPVVDSIGVKNNDGKKMIQFKVKAGDTYYSIGHRYNIKPEALMKYNGAKKATLSLGKIVNVPTDMPFKKGKKEIAEKKPAKETKKEKKARLAREAEEEERLAAKKRKHREQATEQESAPAAATQPVQQPVQQQAVQPPPVQQSVRQPVQKDTTPPTQYKVSAGETLYSIAKRFGTTVDQVTKTNSLTSASLQPGQILLISNTAAPQQQTVQPQSQQPQQAVVNTVTQQATAIRDSTLPSTILKDSADRHSNANKFGIYEKNEKGAATWIDDPSLDPNKKLVLHRTAPIGTVIKITNPMTNRTTFAKVVGRFTDNESTKDVILVMTKNVADSLGALDKRFHVNISYGSPNE